MIKKIKIYDQTYPTAASRITVTGMFSFLRAFAIFCLLKKHLDLNNYFFKDNNRKILSERLKPVTAPIPLLVEQKMSYCIEIEGIVNVVNDITQCAGLTPSLTQ